MGKAVTEALLAAGQHVVVAARQLPSQAPLQHADLRWHVVGSINQQTQWQAALQDVTTVVHCAARAHVMREHAADALAAYREVNVAGTLRLAQHAAAAGVQRFVFISSIGVNGNQSVKPFTEACPPQPHDAYSVSKLEAEKALLALAVQTDMEMVIIRPPLVYGPGAPGNFASLVHWVQHGLPLPLGMLHNQRSLVALDNLVSLVLLCADRTRSPQAVNQVFVVADGEDVSTTTLLRKVAQAAGRPSRLLPLPAWLLRAGASLLGKRAVADRLLGNLQVNATKARTLLGWRPVVTMDEELAKMFPKPASDVDSQALTRFRVQNGAVMRVLDLVFSSVGLLVLSPVMGLLYLLGLFDTGAPLFKQERVGRFQQPFVLVKFRTMRMDTASVASHLASRSAITPFGGFLRKTKLDELPQLWNVLKGEMSLVGPRPCLFNQTELIQERSAKGVFAVRPGITGSAQVKSIDMSTPKLLAETDARMIETMSLRNYFRYIVQTVLGSGAGDRVG